MYNVFKRSKFGKGISVKKDKESKTIIYRVDKDLSDNEDGQIHRSQKWHRLLGYRIEIIDYNENGKGFHGIWEPGKEKEVRPLGNLPEEMGYDQMDPVDQHNYDFLENEKITKKQKTKNGAKKVGKGILIVGTYITNILASYANFKAGDENYGIAFAGLSIVAPLMLYNLYK
jgi:hypothetical protein